MPTCRPTGPAQGPLLWVQSGGGGGRDQVVVRRPMLWGPQRVRHALLLLPQGPPGGHHVASTHRARGLFLHRSCRLCLSSGPFLSKLRIGAGSLGESGTQEMYRHPYPRVPGLFPGSAGLGLKNRSRWKISNIYMPPGKSQRKGTDKPVKGKLTCVLKAMFLTMRCSDQQQQHLGTW